jgi:2-C-methyl-D-erythritol 4-phosphate cytidylyltransferase
MKIVAIILAAGNGSRMGINNQSKVYLKLGSTTVLNRTVSTIYGISEIDQILIVTESSEVNRIKTEFAELNRITVISGGNTRRSSVWQGLTWIKENNFSDDTMVAIHDAARCFISANLFSLAITTAKEKDAVTVAIPLADSLVKVDNNILIKEFIPRENLWSVQTPQVFRFDLIYKGHLTISDQVTDDASLVKPFHDVYVVTGDKENFKLTTPDDYKLAKKVAFTTKDSVSIFASYFPHVRLTNELKNLIIQLSTEEFTELLNLITPKLRSNPYINDILLELFSNIIKHSFSLTEWISSLKTMFSYLKLNSKKPPFPMIIGYLSCCAELGESQQKILPLIIEEALATYGFDS